MGVLHPLEGLLLEGDPADLPSGVVEDRPSEEVGQSLVLEDLPCEEVAGQSLAWVHREVLPCGVEVARTLVWGPLALDLPYEEVEAQIPWEAFAPLEGVRTRT